MSNISLCNYINSSDTLSEDSFNKDLEKTYNIFKILRDMRIIKDKKIACEYDNCEFELYKEDNHIIKDDFIIYNLNNKTNYLLDGIHCENLSDIISVKLKLNSFDEYMNIELNKDYVIKDDKKLEYYSFCDFPLQLYNIYQTSHLFIHMKNIKNIYFVNVKLNINTSNYIYSKIYEVMIDKYILLFGHGFITSTYVHPDSLIDHSDLKDQIKDEYVKRFNL